MLPMERERIIALEREVAQLRTQLNDLKSWVTALRTASEDHTRVLTRITDVLESMTRRA